MRLALVAPALAIVTCTAVFGAIFLQKVSVSGQEPLPVQAGPSGGQASTLMTADSSATNAAGADAAAPIQASPPPAVPPVAAVSSCEHGEHNQRHKLVLLADRTHDARSGAAVRSFSRSMAAAAVACWKSCSSTMPLPCSFNFASTDCRTCSGLRSLKSKGSISAEKMPMFRLRGPSLAS